MPTAPPSRLSRLDTLALVILLALVGLVASYATVELTYDEAVYLTLSRQIVETGLPLRRTFEDITQLRLFQNSPPLVPYLMAPMQAWFPGEEVPTRLLYLLIFVVPSFTLIWWSTRRRFGDLGGLAAALALAGSGPYLASSVHVQLDVPLGLLALVTFISLERAVASERLSARWLALSATAMVAATWTKYQAICIVAAVGAYWVVMLFSAPAGHARRLKALTAVAAAGAAGIALVSVYYFIFDDVGTARDTVAFNAGRMSAGTIGLVERLRAMLEVATKCVSALGAVLLLAAMLAPLIQQKSRDLIVLLIAYVAISLAFNLWFFRLPGAGSYYLNGVVPALAVLAGAAVDAGVRSLSTKTTAAVLACATIVQFVGTPPPLYLPPYPNGPKLVARRIRAESVRGGVLATTSAQEFYTGNPVSLITFSGRQMLLDALAGVGVNQVTYVVIPAGPSPAGTEDFREEWNRLLGERFSLVSPPLEGMLLYRRVAP